MTFVTRFLRTLWIAIRLAKTCRNPLRLATRYLNGEGVCAMELRNGFRLTSAPNDSLIVMVLEVFNDHCYTRDLSTATTGVVLDLGANIGIATIGFLLHSPGLRVHAYEPHPSVRERLSQNLLQNDIKHRVCVYPEAISQRNSLATLMSPGQSMDSRICESEETHAGTQVVTVSLATVFDRVASEKIVMVKLDIEGAEAPALEACPPMHLAKAERYVIEYHNDLSIDALGRCERCLQLAGFATRVQPLGPQRGYLHAWH